MKRGGNRAGLTRMIENIREKIPGITLRSTMIVGFPGETREDFLELKRFCREIEFDRLGVFTYSDEEDTIAYALQPKVPARTAERRRRALMQQQAIIAERKNRRLIGREFKILVEGPSSQSEYLLQGRTESQAPEIDGVCLINDSDVGEVQRGEFRTIRITRVLGHDLLGKIVR
jgi:ribosomal protein S12 methylthiotransferase